MIATVLRSNFRVMDGSISSDASTLGLEPGYWPDFLAIMRAKGDAEGKLARRGALKRDQDGDVTMVEYWVNDHLITVYND